MLLYFSWKIILCPSQQHNARLYVNEGGKVCWFLNFSHYPASVMISAGEHLLKTRKTEAAAHMQIERQQQLQLELLAAISFGSQSF